MMLLVDTNVFLEILLKQDKKEEKMQTSDFGDRRNDFSGHSQAVAGMVHGNLEGDHAKQRCQR